MKKNCDIREAISKARLFYWQVADAYGITDGNFSKLLRKELLTEEKARIMAIIADNGHNQGADAR